MRQEIFGCTGVAVSVLGQGTWHIEQGDRRQAVSALQRGFDLGMTHVDTAEMYGTGRAEDIVGEAIAGRRDRIFLVSKVLPGNASRAGTIAACERSLQRLRTETIDCYLLHWRGGHRLDQTIDAFERLVHSGKIRSWGVSNFDVDDLEEALAIAGPGRIACNQVLYHPGERAIEHAVLPWCTRHGVALTAYSPFGHDDFPDAAKGPGRVLAGIAAAHGATMRQVALAFLTRERNVFAIPKAGRVVHVEENAAAASVKLTQDDLAKIAAAFPLGRRPRSLPML